MRNLDQRKRKNCCLPTASTTVLRDGVTPSSVSLLPDAGDLSDDGFIRGPTCTGNKLRAIPTYPAMPCAAKSSSFLCTYTVRIRGCRSVMHPVGCLGLGRPSLFLALVVGTLECL